jgi:uncharacterized protein
MDAVDQLCPNCGLCCDSTLFVDVELRAGDNAKRLVTLGLSLKKKGRVKVAFAQPCACFDGKLCAIYSERPKRCRLFECGLLKKVNGGRMKADAALKKIAKAKELATRVKDLLGAFEGDDVGMALSERYARAMSEPMDLAKGSATRHGELMHAYENLVRVLQRDFLR